MSKRSKVKQGYLGPAFHEWLQHLEFVEKLIRDQDIDRKTLRKYATGGYSFNNRLWQSPDDKTTDKSYTLKGKHGTLSMNETIYAMMPVDAWVAHLMRSSVKYRCPVPVMLELQSRYGNDLWEQMHEGMQVYLPYDPVTIVFEQMGGNPQDVCVCNITATTATDRNRIAGAFEDVNYPALGIEEGDEFYSASLCMYRKAGVEDEDTGKVDPSRRLSHVPVEVHFNKGLPIEQTKWVNAIAPGVRILPPGKMVIDMVRQYIMHFIAMQSMQSILRQRRTAGLTPAWLVADAKSKRRKPKHRVKRPMFEHYVIELEVDAPDPQQDGHTCIQPRKRQHQVKRHKRTYKSGKVVWVKEHWRGDKNLGVIRKDYEMTTHDFDASN